MENIRKKVSLKCPLKRALLAEFFGTALLVLIINCVVAQSVLTRNSMNTMININIGIGLAIAFGIAVSAKASGGHINPAVSLFFFTFGKLPLTRLLLYILVQTIGAFIGAAITFFVYFDAIRAFDGGNRTIFGVNATAGIFASYPAAHLGWFNGLVDQAVGTGVFCMLIAAVTDLRQGFPSWTQPWLIGAAFTMIGTAFGFNCGYPMNPARDFGPRIFTLIAGYGWGVFSYQGYCWVWIPIVGPLIGAVIGAWSYQFFIGFHTIESDEDRDSVHKYELTSAVATTTTGERELQPLTKKINGEDA